MIEAIHRHLLAELDRAGRSDTIFILSGVSFNLLVLFVNWVQAADIALSSRGPSAANYLIFLIFMAGALLVTGACLLTLTNSKRMCSEIRSSLSKIYQDSDVAKYLPTGLSDLGTRRVALSLIIVGGTGLIAVAVPAVTILMSEAG